MSSLCSRSSERSSNAACSRIATARSTKEWRLCSSMSKRRQTMVSSPSTTYCNALTLSHSALSEWLSARRRRPSADRQVRGRPTQEKGTVASTQSDYQQCFPRHGCRHGRHGWRRYGHEYGHGAISREVSAPWCLFVIHTDSCLQSQSQVVFVPEHVSVHSSDVLVSPQPAHEHVAVPCVPWRQLVRRIHGCYGRRRDGRRRHGWHGIGQQLQ